MRAFSTWRLILAAWLAAAPSVYANDFDPVMGQAVMATRPAITIIIDDLGHNGDEGQRAVALPGPIACSILPHTPHARSLARLAHLRGKEVLLHLPLEAIGDNQFLGPGAITLDDTHEQFRATLSADLAAVPHVSGVNNHMGSLLTRHPGHMGWLMQELKATNGLFFVDSVTTGASIAYQVARENGVPAARRDVFLDHDPSAEHLQRQFDELKARARTHGYAVGIGHPHASTMTFLEQALPTLEQSGYRLIGVKELIAIKSQRKSGQRPPVVTTAVTEPGGAKGEI